MSWRTLSPKTSTRTNVPAIGLQRNGRISWNLATQEALGNPEWVELLFDEERKRLGLRKASPSEKTFRARKALKQQSWGISALGPLKGIGAEINHAYRRHATVENNIVFIDLQPLYAK